MSSMQRAIENILMNAAKVQEWQSDRLGTFKKSIRHYDTEYMYTEALSFLDQDTVDGLLSAVSKLEDYGISTSYRFKSEQSFLYKLRKESNAERPLKKVANDLLGIRLIVNEEEFSIDQIIRIFEDTGYKIITVNFYDHPKPEDDGYRGIHFYIQENTKTFPIEIQVWDYKSALLNFYAHEVIYKKESTGNAEREYALAVRKALEAFPRKPESVDLSFVDYIFDVLYKHMKGEDEDG